jgi:hypothetical protein
VFEHFFLSTISHINERSACFINRRGRDLKMECGVLDNMQAWVAISARQQKLSARRVHQHLAFYVRKLIITLPLYWSKCARCVFKQRLSHASRSLLCFSSRVALSSAEVK